MGRKISDLSNQRFGKLTVLYRDMNAPSGAGHHVKWVCQCDCGKITSVESSKLKSGQIKSCSNACNKSIPIGSKFNKLTVLEMTDQRSVYGGHVIYKCQCDCGNIVYVSSSALKDNRTKSCGCLSSVGESKIESILNKNNIAFNTEVCYPDLISPEGGRLRFDFLINNQYLLEYDGSQHFLTAPKGIYTEEKIEQIKQHDKIKNEYCEQHNIPLIRIPYTHLENLKLDDLLLETTTFRII